MKLLFICRIILLLLTGISQSVYALSVDNTKIEIFDIIINEIMADPTPKLNLPECEYIELYNRNDNDIILKGLSLIVGSKRKEIPYAIIKTGDYLVLCPTGKSSYFEIPHKCLEIPGFPALTNSGQSINIIDSSDNIICFVVYEKSWYKNSFKAEGGWSLEQIDPDNPCGCFSNWTASINPTGGSPGYKNSVYNSNPDLKNPSLNRIAVDGISEITLIFDESMDIKSITNPEIYSFRNYPAWPVNITALAPDYSRVKLILPFEMVEREIYTLIISSQPPDCSGNMLESDICADFTLPEYPEYGDIIINEILFDPVPGGAEFVELFNRSEKCIDLSNLYLTNNKPGGMENESTSQIFPGSFLLFSKEYILITENIADIIDRYNCPYPDRIVSIKKLPSLADKNGSIFLITRIEDIIDEVHYSEDMHHILLSNNEGVSLERISSEESSKILSNWHSASSSTSYASPGYTNSQSFQNYEPKGKIELVPEIFSPDNDGYNDILKISYDFEKNGLAGSVSVYDSNGRLVKDVLNNGLFGSSGSFFWDGTNSKGNISSIGIYIILIEVFTMDGKVSKYKKCCVLAKRI
ncbi:lamin tail domain-containing protein [Bacteroidota bacterium]